MKPELLHILQHTIGVDGYGRGRPYRNHFVAGGIDVSRCRELVDLGFMSESGASPLTGGSPCFHVTTAGRTAVELESPKPPKLSRSKQRYRDYLRSESDESFGDWLRNGRWETSQLLKSGEQNA